MTLTDELPTVLAPRGPSPAHYDVAHYEATVIRPRGNNGWYLVRFKDGHEVNVHRRAMRATGLNWMKLDAMTGPPSFDERIEAQEFTR